MLLLNNTTQARIYLQKRAFFISFFTVAVLLIFQPFGTYETQDPLKYLKLTGYGIATFFAIFVSGLIELQFVKFKTKFSTYPLAILLLNITIAAIFNHAYFVVAILEQWQWINQLMFVLYVSAIAIFPLSVMYILDHSRQENAPEQQKQRPDNASEAPLESTVLFEEKETVTLQGDNKAEQLTLTINEIVYLKAADNYCDIYTKSENALHSTLLRIPLSRAIEQLPKNAGILKCHRSFAVNLSYIENRSGNANGMQLSLKVSDTNIPVSRSFVETVKSALLATTKP